MKSHEKLLFDILQSELWGRPFDREVEKDDLKRAMKLASSHAVLGLVGNVIMTTPHLKAMLSEQEYAVLRKFIVGNLATARLQINVLLKLVLQLKNEGIAPILLKGHGIAQFYPNPKLRQSGDIDLYVGTEDFEKACSIVYELSGKKEYDRSATIEKHFHTTIQKVPIEIHRYTDVYFNNNRNIQYQEISKRGLLDRRQILEIADVEISIPSVNFNVFYIFNHLWHHFVGEGVGLRQICDWTMLLHSSYGKIDLNLLYDSLSKMKMLNQWQTMGWIVVNILGLPKEEFPFYDDKKNKLSMKVLDMILAEGNFGRENAVSFKKPNGYWAAKIYSFKYLSARNILLFRLFPKEACMRFWEILGTGLQVILKDKLN